MKKVNFCLLCCNMLISLNGINNEYWVEVAKIINLRRLTCRYLGRGRGRTYRQLHNYVVRKRKLSSGVWILLRGAKKLHYESGCDKVELKL